MACVAIPSVATMDCGRRQSNTDVTHHYEQITLLTHPCVNDSQFDQANVCANGGTLWKCTIDVASLLVDMKLDQASVACVHICLSATRFVF